MTARCRTLFFVAAAILAGGCKECDKKDDAAGGPAGGSESSDSSSGQGQDLGSLVSLPGSSGGPSAAAEEDGLDRWGRATFDGDQSRPLLRDAVAGVPAGGGSWGAQPASYRMSTPKRIRVSGDVPSPAVNPGLEGDSPSQGGSRFLSAFKEFQKKTYEAAYPVLSRLEWGARGRRGGAAGQSPYRITVHHTQGHMAIRREDAVATARGIQDFHMNSRGWADVGYHFMIDGEGRILEGRPVETIGAHAANANEGNVGIALMGDFNKQKPTTAQLESLERLAAYLAVRYKIDTTQKGHLEGHRNWTHTDCPGQHLMAILARLRLEVDQRADDISRGISGDVYASNSKDFTPILVTET